MRLVFLAAVAALVFASPALAQEQFSSEQQAQQHCPKNTVVWLNIPSGIYHMKGMRWYGATRHGAYVCQQEADKAGDRKTRNGE